MKFEQVWNNGNIEFITDHGIYLYNPNVINWPNIFMAHLLRMIPPPFHGRKSDQILSKVFGKPFKRKDPGEKKYVSRYWKDTNIIVRLNSECIVPETFFPKEFTEQQAMDTLIAFVKKLSRNQLTDADLECLKVRSFNPQPLAVKLGMVPKDDNEA